MGSRFDIALGKKPPEPVKKKRKKVTEKDAKFKELKFIQLKKYTNIEILIETFGVGDWMLLKFIEFLKEKHPEGYSKMITKEIQYDVLIEEYTKFEDHLNNIYEG